MPPGGGCAYGSGEHEHSPATGHGGRDEDGPSRSPPPPPTPFLPGLTVTPVSSQQKKKQKHGHEEKPPASFPDDILIEILSRVPYRSLCRFKCVSKPWLALCSDPDICKRSPQTLSGFFYCGPRNKFGFINLCGRGLPPVDPSVPFLSGYERSTFMQCCGGLLLCICCKSLQPHQFDYVVCNPATQKWTVLPPLELPDQKLHPLMQLNPAKYFLSFDPATPSRFVVFALVSLFENVTIVAIYSSETGGWTYMHCHLDSAITSFCSSKYVFLNGTMHMTTSYPSIVTVDMEGKTWREIEMPRDMAANHYDFPYIGQSQGHLYAWIIDTQNDCRLSVWVLEDYGIGQWWNLKHTVNVLELFGRHDLTGGERYRMFAIHPERNLIFLTDGVTKAVSYDMDNRKVRVFCTPEKFLGGEPYVPCFAKWPSDGH